MLAVLLGSLSNEGLGRPAGNLGSLGLSVEAATEKALARIDAFRSCPANGHGPLALAIAAGEDALRNPVERTVENLIVLAGFQLDFAPPDISFGPAQIRPAHYLKQRGSMAGFWETIAAPCASLAFVQAWIGSNGFAAAGTVEARRSAYAAWSGYPPYDPSANRFFEIAAYYAYCEALYRYASRRSQRG